jgi:hypothetical protein
MRKCETRENHEHISAEYINTTLHITIAFIPTDFDFPIHTSSDRDSCCIF